MKKVVSLLIAVAVAVLLVIPIVGNAGVMGIVYSFNVMTPYNQNYATLKTATDEDEDADFVAVQVKEFYDSLQNPNGSVSFYCKIQAKINGFWQNVSAVTPCYTADDGQILRTTVIDYNQYGCDNITNGTQVRARAKSFSLIGGEPMRGFINFN